MFDIIFHQINQIRAAREKFGAGGLRKRVDGASGCSARIYSNGFIVVR